MVVLQTELPEGPEAPRAPNALRERSASRELLDRVALMAGSSPVSASIAAHT
ncbi:MAG: hypothetical protein RXP27_04620 [Nitrososphaeria archaeon]